MTNYKVKDTALDATAIAIQTLTGESAQIEWDDMIGFADAISEIETGVDTSDANATAADILSGKTAYVNGSKVTGNIAFQPAQTITPGTTNQTITSGKYLTGIQTIKGDANLVASNIAEGISIFGVTGTRAGGGSDLEDSIITRTISGSYENNRLSYIGACAFGYCTSLTSVSFPNCTTIGSQAFIYCTSLTSVSFPNCTIISGYAFSSCKRLTSVDFPKCTRISNDGFDGCSNLTSVSFPICTMISDYGFNLCSKLTSVSFPNCTTIGTFGFNGCYRLTNVSFPKCTTIGDAAFRYCSSLSTASFPSCTTIGVQAFIYCGRLISLYLLRTSVAALNNSNAFSSTPIGGYSASAGKFGSIFVKSSLLTSWQTATNWTYFSSRFVGQ